ncbi:MAG: RagB/SusD family nutrient uptake outer membrane protein [Flavobacteriaceae bacterium]|nr:RagB/SusD family nutrient uptake outer membrane protein [Flavobacteriaceae bacterium]
MKKIFIKSLSLLFLFGISCSEEFLEVEPTEFLTQEQIAEAAKNNPDVIAGSLAGIYTTMFETETGGTDRADDFGQKGYDIYSDMLSGDMALSVSTYGWYRSGITEYQGPLDYTDNSNYIVWRYYYRIIRSANSVIDAAGGNDIVPDLDEVKWILGQAKAMRAYGYFYLTQFFTESYNPSDLILPIYINPSAPNQPKSSTAEVFALIEKDLTDAISLLDNFTRTSKNEVNKYVAKALLAYTYGVMGDNDSVKTLTSDILNNGGFTMMDSSEVTGGFNNVNINGWMWAQDITLDNGLDLVSWWGQIDLYTYSYAAAGDVKARDENLYNAIPADDVRKGQFDPSTGVDTYLMPTNKFYDDAKVISGQRNIETDYVYMRVAEMYLLNAEAAAKTGDEGMAKTSLKFVLNQRVPDASYVDALSGQALLDEIYLQTRIELWGEGKSYLAMKRNKATITRGPNHLSGVGEAISYDDDRLTFEIPQSEIQNNPHIDL